MLREEKNNVDTTHSFSLDADRMTALQAGDARLSGEAINLQDSENSSPLGRSSHEDDGPNLGHVAVLDDVVQSTIDGSSGQNIVEPKRLRNTADGYSWESKRSKNGPSTTQGKNQKPATVSQLGSRSNEDDSAKPGHSVALEDVPQSVNVNVGSSGQNVVDLKKLRIAAGCSSESKKFKVCSPKTLVGGQRSAVVSTLGPCFDGDASARPEQSVMVDDIPQSSDAGSSGQNIMEPKRLRDTADGCSLESQKNKLSSLKDAVKQRQEPTISSKSRGDSYPHKNRFSRFVWKNGDNQIVRTILGIILIVFLNKGLKSPVTLPEAFEMYSNIRPHESQFSEESTSTERRDDQDLCETTGLKAAGSRSSSSTQRIEVPSQVDGNKSSDKKDETLTAPQNLEQADDKPCWLRWFLVTQLVLGPFIYAYANNYFINPNGPISIVNAVPMNLVTTLSIWIVCSSSLSEAINISRSLVKLQG